MLLQSLSYHFKKLQLLNFAKNKIGRDGAKILSLSLHTMKSLHTLNVSQNSIGDYGAIDVIRAVNQYLNLKHLNLNGNSIGQTSLGVEAMDCMRDLLFATKTLETLDLSWNNIRGRQGLSLAEGLVDNASLKKINLSQNLLG